MPIEDLRKLYTSASNIAHVSVTKQEESTTSEEEESSDDDDGGYQRLLIAEHPTLSKSTRSNNRIAHHVLHLSLFR